MNKEQYRAQWHKYQRGYERRAYTIFRRALLDMVSRIPFDNLTYANYTLLIPLNLHQEYIDKAYVDVYTQIGLLHGNRIGKGINAELKDYSKPLFSEEFHRTILDWLRSNVGTRITSVVDTVAKNIMQLVETALGENLTTMQMQKFIRDRIGRDVLTRYEVLRIARTEVTTAANRAATVSGETSGIVLVKEWISSQNDRTRRKPRNQFDHLNMNGVQVGQYEKFTMTGKDGQINQMEYPGDPKGSASNTIQCRCTIALVPLRDADGFVIRK